MKVCQWLELVDLLQFEQCSLRAFQIARNPNCCLSLNLLPSVERTTDAAGRVRLAVKQVPWFHKFVGFNVKHAASGGHPSMTALDRFFHVKRVTLPCEFEKEEHFVGDHFSLVEKLQAIRDFGQNPPASGCYLVGFFLHFPTENERNSNVDFGIF